MDLYHARQRASFIKQAAIELGVTDEVIKKGLAKVLLKCEQLQQEQIQSVLQPQEKAVELTSEEQAVAWDDW